MERGVALTDKFIDPKLFYRCLFACLLKYSSQEAASRAWCDSGGDYDALLLPTTSASLSILLFHSRLSVPWLGCNEQGGVSPRG